MSAALYSLDDLGALLVEQQQVLLKGCRLALEKVSQQVLGKHL
jgi:hypothetical protein